LYNENEPALANDIVITYQNETDGPWIMVDPSNNPNTVDYGNGTYLLSFNVDMQSFLRVSANVHDMRDILVIANTTSMEV
jgi:TPP-dependent indolepyruvate ferredoxin oxidoreductase alpha subunit